MQIEIVVAVIGVIGGLVGGVVASWLAWKRFIRQERYKEEVQIRDLVADYMGTTAIELGNVMTHMLSLLENPPIDDGVDGDENLREQVIYLERQTELLKRLNKEIKATQKLVPLVIKDEDCFVTLLDIVTAASYAGDDFETTKLAKLCFEESHGRLVHVLMNLNDKIAGRKDRKKWRIPYIGKREIAEPSVT